MPMETPYSISLDGAWSFTTDPHERGEREAWFERTSGFGRQVDVPSAWQLYGRDLLEYTGAAWYYKACEIPLEWADRRVRLVVKASDYYTRAWVNGQLVGEHEGGYTPFAFDLSEHVRPGEIAHLVLRVYDPADPSEIPHGEQGRSYTRVSGLWQGATLESRPQVYLSHLTPRPRLNPDRVEVSAELAGATGPVEVRFVVRDHTGAAVGEALVSAESGVAKGSIAIAEPHRWTPDDPYLYTLAATVGVGADEDTLEQPLGLREVAAIDGRLYFNGQPFFIRGAVDSGYWPETLYGAPSDEAIQREIRLAKEAGINLLRKHGKIEDPRYLDWCDRLGMLIWAEAPACSAWTNQSRRRFRSQLQAMIRRDMHHPAIVAWSLFYEGRGLEEAADERRAWLRAMHDEAAELDPTRPICTHAGGASMRTDLLDEHRRYALPEEAREWTTAIEGDVPAAGAPRVVSDFGQWGLPDALPEDENANWWVDATWAAHADASKLPRNAERNFERFKLAAVFEDVANLAKLTQRRQMRGVKGLIEEVRRLPAFAGYVGRAFADTEWEAAGWLSYDREPKLGFDEWASFNGPIAVLAELPKRNFWAGEEVTAKLYVSNHSKNPLSGTINWGVDGADCDGELDYEVAALTTKAVGTISFKAPEGHRPQSTRLALRLSAGGWEVTRNHYEITIAPADAARVNGTKIAVLHLPDSLRDRLSAQGFDVHGEWAPGMHLLTGSLEEDVRRALDAGANVVFLAEAGRESPNTGFLSFRPLPQGDSWERTASMHYIQWDLFPQLPLNTLMGWEMEDLFPHHVMPLEAYGKDTHRFNSNQADEDPANVLAGYFEGWLGNFSASMLVQPASRGRLLTTTLRLGSQYGQHPIGTLLLNRLLSEAHLFELRTVYQLET